MKVLPEKLERLEKWSELSDLKKSDFFSFQLERRQSEEKLEEVEYEVNYSNFNLGVPKTHSIRTFKILIIFVSIAASIYSPDICLFTFTKK